MGFIVWGPMEQDFGILWMRRFARLDQAVKHVVEHVPEQIQHAVVVSDQAGLIIPSSEIRQRYLELLPAPHSKFEMASPDAEGFVGRCRNCISSWAVSGKQLATRAAGWC